MSRISQTYCFFVIFIAATVFSAGCSSGLVQRQGLDATGEMALVSVVLPRLDSPHGSGHEVLQQAVDHAAEQARKDLATVRNWKVIDPSETKSGKAALASFGVVSTEGLAILFPRQAEQAQAKQAVSAELGEWKERFIGARRLLIIPREAFLPDEEKTQKDERVRPVMRQQAGELCKALDVDAVAVIQIRYAITHPRESAFIVTEERTDGLLALSATLTVVDRAGSVIVDMGLRPVDERSRSRDLLPIYRGSGKDAVKVSNIDLADPKKKVEKALNMLIDESLFDLMAALKEELGR
jgi:hypothetical protein